jgi:hypothetical protein
LIEYTRPAALDAEKAARFPGTIYGYMG